MSAPDSALDQAPVTDSHLHLWDLEKSPYTWLQGADPQLRRTGTFAEIREDLLRLGVRRVILVQADDTREDTAHLQRTAARIEAETGGGGPFRANVVGWLPLADPAAVAAALADPSATAHLVGVRHLVHDDPDPGFLDRAEVSASLGLLAEAGLTLDVPDAFPRHMEQVLRVAELHPGLTVVLDHLGKPPLGDAAAMARWREQITRIAARPNVVAKLSGLATSGNGGFRGAADLALELFGPSRLMIGSDWPIAPTPFSLDAGFVPLLEHVHTWDPGVASSVLHGTAEQVYRRTAA
jgi:L-fuconolactonase